MLFRWYLISHFLKRLVAFSFLFAVLVIVFQLFQTVYLIFSLPLELVLSYLLLLVIFTFFLSLAFAVMPALADTLFYLKEYRLLHTFYSFGISQSKIVKTLIIPLFLVAILGSSLSLVINYQKLSYLTKFLKFKFSEKVLLTLPPKSFQSFDQLSVFFEDREGNKFRKIVIKIGEDIATAREGKLLPNGILVLEDASLFSRQGNFYTLMNTQRYTLNIVEKPTLSWKTKKFWENYLFEAVLFLSALPLSVIFSFLFFRKDWGRFKTYLWALFFTFIQVLVAIIAKAIF